MLRKQTVSDDIRDSLLKMIKHALQRNYILCNEAYMEMAIGNAPWPIGVTNAGIHARPARENIFSKHVAHVLNDETQRKYIQVRSHEVPFTLADNKSVGQEVEHVRQTKFDLDGGQMWCARPNVCVTSP